MGRLNGKVAIITGAASGIGAATAELFAKEGAKVVATDIDFEKLLKVVQEINEMVPSSSIAVKHDVAKEEDWDDVVNEAVLTFNRIDILINNAGIGSLGGRARIEELRIEDWEKTLRVNLTSNFIGMKKVVPEMKKTGKGSIINTSSVAGLWGSTTGSAYSSSKGGNRLLAKNAAGDLAKYNIRVNSVHPGYIRTGISYKSNDAEETKKKMNNVPLGFIGDPIDVAYGMLFLASDESRYITGTELVIDGGIDGALQL